MIYDKDLFYELTRQYNLSWETQYLIENILNRIDNPNDDEDIWQSIDDSIIYYKDQWTIIKEYCSPTEANWEYAIQEFTNMIFSLTAQLSEV